ncbi:HofO [Enterobacter cancerogenus]|nr:HofO [Enterobacter cancerogenus]
MERLVERWCTSPPWLRVLCWALCSTALVAIGWAALLRPVAEQIAEAQHQVSVAGRTNASLWSAVRKIPTETEEPVAPAVRPFSPLDFQANGTRLVHWKPLSHGGELELDADWAAIPGIFAQLEQCNVRIGTFVITAESGRLRLRMELQHGA